MRPLPLISMLLLLGGPSLAEVPATPRLEQARAAVEEARGEHVRLRAEQLSLSKQVGALSQRITTLKSGERRGSAGELDAALKQSQALATRLGAVSREEATAKARLERAQTALIHALGEAMAPLQDALGSAEARDRPALLSRLQALRTESERLRAALGPARVELLPPLPEMPPAGAAPERILARVDVLRDQEHRVRTRLKDVRERLELARAEARLARGMDAFLGRRNLFDESDRRLSNPSRNGENAPEFSDGQPAPSDTPATGGDGGALDARSLAARGGAIDTAALAGRPHERGPAVDEHSVSALEALEKELETRARELAREAAKLEAQL
ncbi:MAG TPA: hypothetical protein VK013_02180 [Myxococcaceae bacterium]|nr:hypothetical protein [Myxococcaceae bacterium]